jgi:hypothetical protein
MKHIKPSIVPDATWPGMFRIRLADGSLTDMVNRARAKEVLANISAAPGASVSKRRAP